MSFSRSTPMTDIFLHRLNDWSERISASSGAWINNELIFGVTWFTLFAGLIVLALVLVADLLMRSLIRRKIRSDRATKVPAEPQHERESRHWLDLTLEAMLRPLALLIWIYGLYLVLSVTFIRWRVMDEPSLLIAFLERVREFGVFVVLLWFVFRMIHVVDFRLRQLAAATPGKWDDILVPLVAKALRIVLPLVALILAVPMLNIEPESHLFLRHLFSLLLIMGVAMILFQLVRAVEEGILSQYRIDVSDNLEARKIYTQVMVLKKVAFVVIGIFTIASMLMVFESVRQLGTSILASAGIAGIIIGFAAQKSIATLLAGFQIALTQPIRLDDVVIVEKEWGRIEEITLTYVVVKIWDLRRLIVPINYFIEQPFQNWTRVSADILGTVFLYLDYTVPLETVRKEFERLLEESPHWDKKVKVVQVTDAKETTVEVRLLASARDAGTAWDLRCHLREKMLDFLQKNHPRCLPRLRAELEPLEAVNHSDS